MDDTRRIDALSSHGLCITQLMELRGEEWLIRWVCHFGIDQKVEALTIREAIDSAVREIEGAGNGKHRDGEV